MKADNMKRAGAMVSMGMLAMVSFVAGCADPKQIEKEAGGITRVDPRIEEANGPKWITEKGAAFSGERRVLYGVGNASGFVNPTLRRKAAEGQARNDLAASLQVYVASLQKGYLAATTAGDPQKHTEEDHIQETWKIVTEQTLYGAQAVAYWENPLRNEAYALVRMDIEQFKEIMQSYASVSGEFKQLDANLRDWVRKNADKAHDELNDELKKKKQG